MWKCSLHLWDLKMPIVIPESVAIHLIISCFCFFLICTVKPFSGKQTKNSPKTKGKPCSVLPSLIPFFLPCFFPFFLPCFFPSFLLTVTPQFLSFLWICVIHKSPHLTLPLCGTSVFVSSCFTAASYSVANCWWWRHQPIQKKTAKKRRALKQQG